MGVHTVQVLAPPSMLLSAVALSSISRAAHAWRLRGAAPHGASLLQPGSLAGPKLAPVAVRDCGFERLRAAEQLPDDFADNEDSGILDRIGADRGGQGTQQGRQNQDTVSRLQRVGRLVDTDGDARLSLAELQSFARGLKDRQRRKQSADALRQLDADGSGDMTLAELPGTQSSSSPELLQHQERRFRAADADGNGRLDAAEFHAFVHPEVDESVFRVELDHQFAIFDADGNGLIDFGEFEREGRAHGESDFSLEAAQEDFSLHDSDADGHLGPAEFGRLIAGHDLLEDSIRKAIEAGDNDGDGHIHVDHELPDRLQHLLESEFVEDFFFHEHAEDHGRHDEL